MKLRKDSLIVTLANAPKVSFPNETPYHARYLEIADFLEKEIHPYVAIGAMIEDKIFLNNHGPEHIATVIARASELVSFHECSLNNYEVYLLLMAIQVHDIGNLLGRKTHEEKARRLSEDLRRKMGSNAVERKLIFDIAAAHGGKANGDLDRIARLPPRIHILHTTVDPQKLAAILRFADELADDRRRAARVPSALGIIPEASRVHHKYSESLQSVVVDQAGGEVFLDFELQAADVFADFVTQSTDNSGNSVLTPTTLLYSRA